jgi:hypothetical protein
MRLVTFGRKTRYHTVREELEMPVRAPICGRGYDEIVLTVTDIQHLHDAGPKAAHEWMSNMLARACQPRWL